VLPLRAGRRLPAIIRWSAQDEVVLGVNIARICRIEGVRIFAYLCAHYHSSLDNSVEGMRPNAITRLWARSPVPLVTPAAIEVRVRLPRSASSALSDLPWRQVTALVAFPSRRHGIMSKDRSPTQSEVNEVASIADAPGIIVSVEFVSELALDIGERPPTIEFRLLTP